MTEILAAYVRAVAQNVPLPLTDPIDLVIGGGAFNGAYGLGAILVVKELEKQDKVKIERVSGCSVGGLLALAYFTDIGQDIEEIFSAMRDCLKRDGCLRGLRDMITELVEKAFPGDLSPSALNDRLFLTHTDINALSSVVTSTYADKEALVDSLFRSSFIPLLINGSASLDNTSIDGIVPHLFKDSQRDSLYINLVDYGTIMKVVVTRNEVNPHYRVMQGAADASQFFVEGKSRMCSWVSNWGIAQYGVHRGVFLIWTTVILLVRYTSRFCPPSALVSQPIVRLVTSTLVDLFRDVIYTLSA